MDYHDHNERINYPMRRAGTPYPVNSAALVAAEAAIRDLSRISRPGCRVYLGRDEIKRVQGGLGISIMTTPRGVMTGRQARKEGVGGEILCEVW